MIDAKTFVRKDDRNLRATKLQAEGSLTEITTDLAAIVQKVYQLIAARDLAGAQALRDTLIGVMTTDEVDFWALPGDGGAMQS